VITTRTAPGRDRLLASLWDYLVVVAFLFVALLIGAAITAATPLSPTVMTTDLLAFLCSVLPTWIYLTTAEAGPRQATWGKHHHGLLVIGPDQQDVTFGRSALRNAVKLLPWQLAHLAVSRLALDVDATVMIGVTYGGAVLLIVVTLLLAWRTTGHRALHDLIAGTRVEALSR